MAAVPHLMTLADLSGPQILRAVSHAYHLKQLSTPWLAPQLNSGKQPRLRMPSQSLFNNTRTRVAAETASLLLGGRSLFLGKEDIQLGVNETPRDTARVIGGMCQGIFARVGDHSEIEELAKYSPVPVLNALSSLWHPTQVLADVLTLHEHAHLFDSSAPSPAPPVKAHTVPLPKLRPLTVAYVGDSANVLHDMLVTYPRLGHSLRIATPQKPVYQAPKPLKCDHKIWWGTNPREAVQGADVVVTDTWSASNSLLPRVILTLIPTSYQDLDGTRSRVRTTRRCPCRLEIHALSTQEEARGR
ncbi:Aspartate/ornithine carbamoyltransferase [Multifurca ochricompacta]|uniref:ornithine carbamoyltransferase n=1 Tax=Multifurca ochricompacta TaxID=376703 RepID=A0AAD4LZC6_9AGAM|nr:Aspartate/ornithine carbamoyltransferase [Multifurca ochricompacta]